MSVFDPNSLNLREVLIFCFHLKKATAGAYRLLSSTYTEAALSERTCREWFQRYKSEDFMPNARRIGIIIRSYSTSHLEKPQSHDNDSEARKFGSVRCKAERR